MKRAGVPRARVAGLLGIAGVLPGLAGALVACGSGDDAATTAGPADGATDAAARTVDAAVVDASSDAADGAPDGSPDPCADAGVPPPTLACAGLYADFASKTLAPDALAYTPATPLWSDGAQKQRWIELPPGTQIDISDPNEWSFPIGTKLFKEFRVEGKRVETRMFVKVATNFWDYATYAWNADDSEAPINFGGPVTVPVGDGGVVWTIPTNDDCDECHRGRQDRILGFEQVGLGLPGAQGLTLAELAEMGLVTPAPASVSLTIGDDGTGLDALAMGWIHVNCGVTCHNSNPAAAGYGAGMLLRLDPTQLDGTPPDASTWDILSTTVGVPCVSGSLVGQPRIEPGASARSVIVQLIDERGALQMPPIASLVVDNPDVAIVADWIQALGQGSGAGDAGLTDAGGHRELDGGEHGVGPADASAADAADAAAIGADSASTAADSGAVGADSGGADEGDASGTD